MNERALEGLAIRKKNVWENDIMVDAFAVYLPMPNVSSFAEFIKIREEIDAWVESGEEFLASSVEGRRSVDGV